MTGTDNLQKSFVCRHALLCLFSVLMLNPTYAQIGGRSAFDAIALPTNARVTGLGGSLITVMDNDIALAQMNPAVADSIMDKQLSLNHNFHFAGIQNGNVAYGKYIEKWGVLTHAAIQYVSFGDFDVTDAFGNVNGEFSAGEVGLLVGTAIQLNERIRGGVNLKFLFGNYEDYSSVGMGADIGFHYKKPDNRTTWAMVLRNVGGELSALGAERRYLPFDLQIGVSKKLQHLPFRFSIIGHHLQNPYIRYDDPETDVTVSIFGEETYKSSLTKNIDNLFRHLIFSGEFLLGSKEQLRLRFGYDHLRRQELRTTTFRSMGGFSFGVGFNVKKIKIDYGIGNYHLAGAVNHISFRYDMGRIFNKI